MNRRALLSTVAAVPLASLPTLPSTRGPWRPGVARVGVRRADDLAEALRALGEDFEEARMTMVGLHYSTDRLDELEREARAKLVALAGEPSEGRA